MGRLPWHGRDPDAGTHMSMTDMLKEQQGARAKGKIGTKENC